MCLCPLSLRNSEPTKWFSYMTPYEHPPTPPPCRWPTLITLRTLTKFELVWRRLCDEVVFRSSCLFERTLCATRGSDWSYYKIHCLILCPYKCPSYFDQTCIVLKLGWRSTTGPPDLWSTPVPVSPPDATAKSMACSHHFTTLLPSFKLVLASLV